MSRDWGKFKLKVQFQLGACQMVNFETNRRGQKAGDACTCIHKLYNQTYQQQKTITETWVGVGRGELHIL